MKTVICVKSELQGKRALEKIMYNKAKLGINPIRYTSKYLKVKFEDGTEYQAIEYRNFYGIIADKIIVDDILTPEEYMRVMTYAKEYNNG